MAFRAFVVRLVLVWVVCLFFVPGFFFVATSGLSGQGFHFVRAPGSGSLPFCSSSFAVALPLLCS